METIGGYRLVRLLGEGRRARVWLGHAPGVAPVAVKIFRAETSAASIEVEVEALGRSSSAHLLRLDDLAFDAEGRPALVLQRLKAPLSTVTASRALRLGEVVTALAPIAEAVAELHRVGVAHRRIGAASILFDPFGCPILSRFGAAELIGEFPHGAQHSLTPAERSSRPSLLHDLESLRGLALSLIGGASVGRAFGNWLSGVELADQADVFATELSIRLHRIAEPEPVGMPGGEPGDEHRLPARILLPGEVRSGVCEDDDGERPESGDPIRATPDGLPGELRAVPSGVRELLAAVLETGPAPWLRERVINPLRAVRKRVWILAGAVALAVVVAAAMLPESGDPTPSETTIEEPSSAASAPGSPAVGTDEGASGEGQAQSQTEGPEAAGFTLLLRRTQCLAGDDTECLSSVYQSGMSSERRARALNVALGEPDSVELLERLGDAALLAVSTVQGESGTLLLVLEDGTWRIRELWANEDRTLPPASGTR